MLTKRAVSCDRHVASRSCGDGIPPHRKRFSRGPLHGLLRAAGAATWERGGHHSAGDHKCAGDQQRHGRFPACGRKLAAAALATLVLQL